MDCPNHRTGGGGPQFAAARIRHHNQLNHRRSARKRPAARLESVGGVRGQGDAGGRGVESIGQFRHQPRPQLLLPSHGNQKNLDVENFIKPVIDALAAGLFCDPDQDPQEIAKWGFDDSNFRTLLIHRLDDATRRDDEGVAISVSSGPRF